MKIIFAGTPQFAEMALSAIIPKHEVVAVYTQPDRPSGRGMQLTSSPVKQLALKHGIPVIQPASLKDVEAQEQLRAFGADVMVVAAYGLLLPETVLGIPHYGCLNIHASLLPRWRGAAPIQRAIQAGDKETGITIMQMDVGLDTGAMLSHTACPIAAEDTAQTLHDKLALLGANSILEVLGRLPQGVRATPQDESEACYAKKLLKSEAPIDWHEDAIVIERKVRAYIPFPVCTFRLGDSAIKIMRASVQSKQGQPGTVLEVDRSGITVACGTGAIRLEILQKPGGKPLEAERFVQGCPITAGTDLTLA